MPASSLPTVALMQPTLIAQFFHGAGWVYEEKYDGGGLPADTGAWQNFKQEFRWLLKG